MATKTIVIFSNNRLLVKNYILAASTFWPCEKTLPGDEQGDPQPFVLVGDEAFALSKHLLRPFPGRNLNDERRIFNYRLSRARQHIECTFGILSNKWRVFHSTNILVEPDFAILITKASCVLHNFVRRRD